MLTNYKETDTDGSNCFIYSRFLIPYLTGYKGNALFIDGDMIVREDLQYLFNLFDSNFAVQVVKHDYKTKFPIKYLGSKNEDYPKKNWSSVILYNCEHPKNKILTPEFLNQQTPKFLHRFTWLDDSEIGSLPHNYNWLVGWYKEPQDGKPKILHYTEGGPWFDGYRDCEYSDDWKKEVINLFSA